MFQTFSATDIFNSVSGWRKLRCEFPSFDTQNQYAYKLQECHQKSKTLQPWEHWQHEQLHGQLFRGPVGTDFALEREFK